MKKSLLFLLVLFGISCSQNSPVVLEWQFIANDVEPGVCEAQLTMTNVSHKTLKGDWKMYFGFMSLHPIYNQGDQLKETEIQASYHSLEPTETFVPLKAGESRSFVLRYRGSAIRENIHPEGVFIVRDEKPGKKGVAVSVPLTTVPYTNRLQMQRQIDHWEKTPYADGEYVYSYIENILSTPKTDKRLLPLLPQPKIVIWGEGYAHVDSAQVVVLNTQLPEEGYRLRITHDTIYISTNDDAAGIYYAKQTLAAITNDGQAPCVTIIDWPDLHHRGIMLDIVRNYYPADSIKRVLDVMATQKLNVLHLHISDDEGWRLEISGLPELTEQGARRGYSLDETECLWPMYVGGWDYTNPNSTNNGYVTREEYIALIQYAAERQIRIIPEVDMPGHMRGCKKAMHGLLTDSVLEARKYNSAQNYNDNVIAVSNPYALEFIDKVITEIVAMYRESGYPLSIFNIGGDEVPKGALTKEEHQAYIDGVLAILAREQLQPMGWEEIDHFCAPETKAICYSWHNTYEKSLEMADKGYPVVLANANRLYFDFAYCKHHQEKGLDWGGFTDEYRSFDWEPLIHDNIIGMNAQLWSEVIRDFSQVEWQIYPKIYGLAERSWNNRSVLTLSEYNTLVYEVALPRLHARRHNFHLQQPGIHVADGIVTINKVMQGGTISYTTDGTNWQTYQGAFAIDTTEVETIMAKIDYLDHESNTTWWWKD
ncbi:MAG: carbohydate-binding domain-containing protein [Paludibacteraceae bacterium]|nr:carbohydate-binding domain-containing protein [Paludibacteraceae bacterium]